MDAKLNTSNNVFLIFQEKALSNNLGFMFKKIDESTLNVCFFDKNASPNTDRTIYTDTFPLWSSEYHIEKFEAFLSGLNKKKKHKCTCSGYNLLWFGCKCGGI